MKKIKKLSLNKEVIANLDQSESLNIKGGFFTQGCTDGCTVSFTGGTSAQTWFAFCTEADCTADCNEYC